jgi:hypothetical protein
VFMCTRQNDRAMFNLVIMVQCMCVDFGLDIIGVLEKERLCVVQVMVPHL